MTSTDEIRVVLVDDQSLVRSGFKLLINSQDDMKVVGEAADGAEVPAIFVDGLEADIILMDVQMPAVNGIDATRSLVASGCNARVIMLTTFDDHDYVKGAIEAGASGFLLKDAEPEELLHAIRTVHSGNAVLAPKVTAQVLKSLASAPSPNAGVRPQPLPSPGTIDKNTTQVLEALTAREREILRLIGLGLSNDEIAASEFVSMATVKTHVRHILMKTGSRDRVQAVLFAYRAGVVGFAEMLEYEHSS